MSFWTSKFAKDLENGKLPPVQIEFETEQLVRLGLTLFLVIVLGALAAGIIKTITK